MKTDSFWILIPKGVKVAATIVFVCALVTGPSIGAWQGHVACLTSPHGILPEGLGLAIGFGIGLIAGVLVAFWLLCVGYVYADARRRAMPPVLWVLVVILIPNLLGFLLYFALRRPLVFPCPSCGQLVAADQRFCAWCGSQRTSPPSAPGNFPSPGSGTGPTAAV